ncbi:hypothetical protein [Pantoea stewartii]|uniref:DUF2116 family Zn-ribbon domain-containing protein n=1 Tax=Pantoea stewartii subsp. stewartii DC283 TaxID=660596 RepID=H3RBP6_PANSE|nr:hypothetical protein [Pantoea stewartii]ARF49688.1 hypothetical protein DSJ_10275 [Pantoea stewartii subsp. stewartii DC283]EHU01385.1 hypothetical protein CKS_4138 [Pantoea stewartii subsp. stewartii DC283]KAB0551401.1 hypothetical protein F7Q90_18135 [Pantoea stewartii subsp. stewartii]
MDEVDLAQQLEQAIIAAALENRKKSPVSPDGKCIWCKDEPVVDKTAFCSADCGVDYFKHEREMKQRITGD